MRPSLVGSVLSALALAPALFAVPLADSRSPKRGNFDASFQTRSRAPHDVPDDLPGVATAWDDRWGVPSFFRARPGALRVPRIAAPADAGVAAFDAIAPAYGLSRAARAAVEVRAALERRNGSVLVVLGQRVDGLEVHGQELKLLLAPDRALVAAGGTLLPRWIDEPGGAARFRLGSEDALGAALRHLHGVAPERASWRGTGRADRFGRHLELAGDHRLRAEGLALTAPARAGTIWFPLGERLVPAYRIELQVGRIDSTDGDAWLLVVAADDGRILLRRSLKHEAIGNPYFDYRVWAPDAIGTPADGPHADFSPHPSGTPDDSLPDPAAPDLVNMAGFNTNPELTFDPWLDPAATESSGNNVDAYTDSNAPDGLTAGDFRATTTADHAFDRVYDLDSGPLASQDQGMAAVTQLFYTNNWLHDWWYDSGFDEAAGNAQVSNFGRGGIGGDPIHAQAQDAALVGARNNANMSVPADGLPPRMQMYLWTSVIDASVTTSIAPGTPLAAGYATGFGAQSFDVTAPVALVADGGGASTTDACESIAGSLTGKIALIDRGNCAYNVKVKNAQVAGASGAIIADSVSSSTPPSLGSTVDATVTIGALSITLADGNTIKGALGGGVTATIHRSASVERSGELDGSLVAHEWGHYLHLRLVSCGSHQCAAEGEGWGDFLALHTSIAAGDDAGTGTWASAPFATLSASPDSYYFGFRRYPYSGDAAKSPLTFRHIADGEPLPEGPPANPNIYPNSEVHNAGEVWAAMLLDAYRGILGRHAFDDARRRMSDIVVAGMQLAPADPTFTEQRDALLAAALAIDAGDAEAIADAFALRGAGSCAVSPARDSTDLTGVVEDFATTKGRLAIGPVTLEDDQTTCDGDGNLDAGETGQMQIGLTNLTGSVITGYQLQVVSSDPNIVPANGGVISAPDLAPFEATTIVLDVAATNLLLGSPFVTVTAQASGSPLCAAVEAAFAGVANFDPAPSTSDSASVASSPWTETGTASGSWTRIADPLSATNLVFAGAELPFVSDVSWESPTLQVSAATPFVVTFEHRHGFEYDGTAWDGGVVEYSTNGGSSWTDVSALVTPGYGGTITDVSGNPLALRDAYVGTNPGWPARETVTLNFGTQLASQSVRIRFRIGTDQAATAFGWEIDDVAVSGITNSPFLDVGPNLDPCAGTLVFKDGFASGNATAWSAAIGN